MGFKVGPSQIVRLTTLIENLPRRAAGRPLIDPRTRDPEVCSPQARAWILTGFDLTRGVIPQIRGLGGECVRLADCLDMKAATLMGHPTDVYVTCANCSSGQSSSSASASSMQLCVTPYSNPDWTRDAFYFFVFGELIRICGGKLLDVCALWYYLFTSESTPQGRVFYQPLPASVKNQMCDDSTLRSGLRYGTFMAWGPFSGTLYAKYVYPDGSWGTVAGGSLTGFSHPYWQHSCPP